MTHRVHTILSILADDHAPAALRPSILLAIDWPTVAEEAPATGDDATAATLAALRIRGAITSDHQALATCAARIATVAASLTATGDNAMSAHAAALWGAAAALVGLPGHHSVPTNVDPSTAEVYLRALAKKAADIIPGAIAPSDPAAKATIIATALDRVTHWRAMVQARDAALGDLGWDGAENLQAWTASRKAEHDKALADIHALRDILNVPAGGNIVDHASAFAERHMRRVDEATAEAHRVNEDNARLRAQVDRMIAAMREDAPPPAKPRPQPGDVVPWTEVEPGCLYYAQCRLFRAVLSRQVTGLLIAADDSDLKRLFEGTYGKPVAGAVAFHANEGPAILVARDLGTDPEAWRAAMREWMTLPPHYKLHHGPDGHRWVRACGSLGVMFPHPGLAMQQAWKHHAVNGTTE